MKSNIHFNKSHATQCLILAGIACIPLLSFSATSFADYTILTTEASSVDDLFLTDTDNESANQGDDGAPTSGDELFGPSEERTETEKNSTELKIDGFYQLQAAFTYPSPDHGSMARNILEMGTDGRFSENISWKLSGRLAYDAIFELNDFYSSRVRENRQFNAIFYETYMDISAGDLDFRLGRQNIIWGEMVGLFFADVVSAKDTRQFVAQDFDLIRIPQWAARAEYFKEDFYGEIIWIPYMTYNEIGEPGDDFYPLGTIPPPDTDLVIRSDQRPANSLSNSAYGARVSMLKSGWDIAGFYYRSVDAEPAFFSEPVAGPTPTLIITPEHTKIHQFGATLAKDFGKFVLKSEAVYTKDRWAIVDDPGNKDGVVQQDFLDYVIGLEHTTPNNTFLNFQFYQRWYTDYDSDILFDEFETGIGLFGKVDIGSKIEAELLLISQLNRSDWMARPRVTWFFAQNWFVQAGADIFGGDEIGYFGRFDDSGRVYGNVRYTF